MKKGLGVQKDFAKTLQNSRCEAIKPFSIHYINNNSGLHMQVVFCLCHQIQLLP